MIREISKGVTVYAGLSTDTKPNRSQDAGGAYINTPENLSLFIELDTGDIYYYSHNDWQWHVSA